ncbi:MAG: Sodium Bile acid symporter family protein [Rariglobus sp.]|jgi:BASS family bile acid:Na+ symporter|nr:Sodium Bile acid symporter family protein [Rariglobus sp.]
MGKMILTWVINAYPLWVLAGAAWALGEPGAFAWFQGPWIEWTLALVMLGMGLTLTTDDFRRVGTRTRAVTFGFFAQYTIMPLLGWGIGRVLGLEPPLAVGLILVGCCPGGTASNVVTYLARADVALSVVMTLCSTLTAVIMTPLLTRWLAGTLVEVNATGLLLSTLKVVIAPVLLGVVFNRVAPRIVARVVPLAPLVSVAGIVLIVASVVGANATVLKTGAVVLLLAVSLLHAGGFAIGYAMSRLFRFDVITARTVSIEVGMQNSGLGVVLARRHFADPLTALPGAIASVMQSLVGSLLAGVWRLRDRR